MHIGQRLYYIGSNKQIIINIIMMGIFENDFNDPGWPNSAYGIRVKFELWIIRTKNIRLESLCNIIVVDVHRRQYITRWRHCTAMGNIYCQILWPPSDFNSDVFRRDHSSWFTTGSTSNTMFKWTIDFCVHEGRFKFVMQDYWPQSRQFV